MKTYIEQLFENCGMETPSEYLIEGASTKAPQYKVTSPEEFEMLVSQDPTFDSAKDDGKFIDWIFSLWRNFKTDEQKEKRYQKAVAYKQEHPEAQLPPKPTKLSQDKLEDFEKIRDFLLVLKDNIKLIKGNMSQFKSISDLASFVREIKEKDISVDDKAKDNFKVFREAMADGLEVVYNGPNFIIGVPITYEASSHFKKPVTDWCTAYPDMYNEYLKYYGGKYYIHLNKHTGDLYQLHYESNQFKDASDKEINKKEFISDYSELKEFYDKILPMNNYKWWILHNKQPTEEEQLKAVERNGHAIYYIKNPSEEVQLAAVKEDGHVIEYIKNPTEEIQLAAVNSNGEAIIWIKNPSKEVQLAAVKEDGMAIGNIKNPSEEIQLVAVKQDGYAIGNIKNPSEEVQLAAVNNDERAIQFIENPSEEIQLIAINKNGLAIKYIENPSEKVQLVAVKRNPVLIDGIKNPCKEAIELARKRGYYNGQFIDSEY